MSSDSIHLSLVRFVLTVCSTAPYQIRGPMYTMNQIGSHDATRKYQ